MEASTNRPKGVRDDQGNAPNARFVLLTMIEEYARHNGHAVLIRAAGDRLVGHDPPDCVAL